MNKEENLTKYAGSIYAYVKKKEKIGKAMRKVSTSRKSKTQSTTKCITHFNL